MAEKESLGFVETIGLVTAIEAADAMSKAARVRIKTVVNADLGLLSVICEGDLAACKAAVDAGKAAAAMVGDCVSSNIIARPYEDTDELITGYIGSSITRQPLPAAGAGTAKGKSGGRSPKGKDKK